MLTHNEFHISKKVRDLCDFDKGLFASSGNVVFANMKNVRAFQLLFNNYIETVTGDQNKKVSAGQLNAMGLIDEIFHHVFMRYRQKKSPLFMKELLILLNNTYTKEQIDNLLFDFMKEFPPVEVYQEKCTPAEYLDRIAVEPETQTQRTNREQQLAPGAEMPCHTHTVGEILCYYGSDPADPYNLHAEIEFVIGNESHVITKSSLIFVPAGVPHSKPLVNAIDRPVFHFAILLGQE